MLNDFFKYIYTIFYKFFIILSFKTKSDDELYEEFKDNEEYKFEYNIMIR